MHTKTRSKNLKDSGIDWLGNIPQDWHGFRILEAADIINGYPFDSEKFSKDEGVPLVRIRDIASSEAEVRYSGEMVDRAKIKKGDTLIGMDGDFNVSMWSGGDALLNQRVCCLRSKGAFGQRYLTYLIRFPLKVINDLTYGTTVKHLSSLDLEKVVFFAPNLKEQEKIGDYLDFKTSTINRAIKQKRQLIDLLREKRTAIINHAVTRGLDENVELVDSGVEWIGKAPKGWRVERLKFLMKLQNGFAFSSDDYIDEGVPLIRIGEVKENIDFENTKKLPVDYVKSLPSFLVQSGDLLIAMTGYVGETAMYIYDQKSLLNQRVGIMKPKSGVSTKFLYYWTLVASFKTFLSLQSKSSAQENVGETEIGKFQISMPELDEQMQIVASLDKRICAINNVIHKTERSMDILMEYRMSLIWHVVTGKVEII